MKMRTKTTINPDWFAKISIDTKDLSLPLAGRNLRTSLRTNPLRTLGIVEITLGIYSLFISCLLWLAPSFSFRNDGWHIILNKIMLYYVPSFGIISILVGIWTLILSRRE